MAEQRLPLVNGDDGQWGDLLNQYLEKEHYNTGVDNVANGGHKKITVQPGTASAGTAPLKFASGPLMATPEVGAVEFLTDTLYLTQTTATTRKKIATYDDSSGATGDIYYRDSSGYFRRLAISATANSVLRVNSGLPSWGASYNASAAASTIPLRDANANILHNNIITGFATTTTAAGTTTLTVSSKRLQFFTGSTTQTVQMPVTSTLALGQQWQIVNNSTGLVTVKSSGSNDIIGLTANTGVIITCILTSGTTAASWSIATVRSNQMTIGTTTPGAPNIGDVWIDTN
jgi:hypothetical protein